ncbi:MAG: glycoside hydrolase family 36 protein [Armatimonadota bacterium]
MSTYSIDHEGMRMEFERGANGPLLVTLNTTEKGSEIWKSFGTMPFAMAVAGQSYGFSHSMNTGVTEYPWHFLLESEEQTDSGYILNYVYAEKGLSAKVEYKLSPGTPVTQVLTTIANHGTETITLTHLSSALFPGLATDGVRPWNDPGRILVHTCRNVWEGEGQWQTNTLEELGLYVVSEWHKTAGAVHIGQTGSQSTARYMPMIMLEDTELGKIYFAHIEGGHNWHIEVGSHSNWDGSRPGMYLQLDGADERYCGWSLELKPGDTFTAAPAVVGVTEGGFEEAVRALDIYKRQQKPVDAWEGEWPVCFNDYMNAIWANPSLENERPLFKAAKKAGADVYCIDAGWFCKAGFSWSSGLGDWVPSPDRFGEIGLQGLLDEIMAEGLVPGIWLEMEIVGFDSEIAKKPDDWFLMRHGKRVFGQTRYFFNWTNPGVRAYMHGVIDMLVGMGVGFIKNDYNECVGVGADNLGSSAAHGLIVNNRAFYSFIDEVCAKHPRLIIENCGSGAMREEPEALKHFHVQSFSDQEYYTKCPSIIVGSLGGILPEQLGNWVFPYPLLYPNISNLGILDTPEYLATMADGEETVFNVVNGLVGNFYLSGHIDKADEFNMGLIQEGVSLYRELRSFIRQSFPFWPTGMTGIQHQTKASVGLINEAKTEAILAVWRLEKGDEMLELPLKHFSGKKPCIEQIYPSKGFECQWSWNAHSGVLTVKLPKACTGRLLKIRL